MSIRYAAPIDLGGNRITSVAQPTSGGDVATKDYVDASIRGLEWKPSVRVATTANLNLAAPGSVVDGVPLNPGDRVLVKDQSTGAANGLYIYDSPSTAMVRATDADTNAKVTPGMATSVEEGSVNGDRTFILTTNNPLTLGATALTFSGLGGLSYTAGFGLTLSGTVFAVDATALPRKVSALIGDGTNSAIVVTHNLNSRDVAVDVYGAASPYETVTCLVTRPTANTVQLNFSTAPAANSYRVVVVG